MSLSFSDLGARAGVILVISLLCAKASASASCEYRYSATNVAVDGKGVVVETYRPFPNQIMGVIVLLHGSAGVYSVQGQQPPPISNFGEYELARHCFVVFLPHYFDLIGTKSLLSKERMRSEFPQIKSGLSRLIETVTRDQSLEGLPLFLYGESYGGYFAADLAASYSSVKAVSVFSTGYPDDLFFAGVRPPPILMQHGELDDLVPLSEAKRLGQAWQEYGGRVDWFQYADVGHMLSESVRAEVLSRTCIFFEKLSLDRNEGHVADRR